MKKKRAKQGSKRRSSIKSVRRKRSPVNPFEAELTEEFARARKRLSARGYDRWAVRKLARVMAIAARLAQIKAGRG